MLQSAHATVSAWITTRVYSTVPSLALVLQTIPLMTLAQRKFYLDMTRRQLDVDHPRFVADLRSFPHEDWVSRGNDITPNYIHKYLNGSCPTGLQIAGIILEMYYHPIYLSIISFWLRAESFPDHEERLIMEEAVDKELEASQTSFPEAFHNYSELLRERKRLVPTYRTDFRMHRLLACPDDFSSLFRPLMHDLVVEYRRGYGVAFKTHNIVLWPKVSLKHVSVETQMNMDHRSCSHTDVKCNAVCLERSFAYSGDIPPGRCQMKVTWGLSDLKPRVYYNYGGTSHKYARFLKVFFNKLTDLMDATSVKHRYNINKIFATSAYNATEILIYDYSSFTTMMSELKWFTAVLAWAFADCEVDCSDLSGTTVRDLKDLITEYNDHVNVYPDFDYVEKNGFKGVRVQMNSGMLGVIGNITTSMFLHGLIAACYLGHDEFSVVGDDGMIPVYESLLQTSEDLLNVLGTIGIIHPEKPEIISYHETERVRNHWYYLKRPVRLTQDGALTGTLLQFPNFLAALDKGSSAVRATTDKKDFISRVRTFVTQVSDFFVEFQKEECNISDEEMEVVLNLFCRLYTVLGLPYGGSLPGNTRLSKNFGNDAPRVLYELVPALDKDSFMMDPIDVVWNRDTASTFAIQRYGYAIDMRQFGWEGDVVVGPMTPGMRYFSKVEVIKADVINDVVEKTEKNKRLLSLTYRLDKVPLYSFSVVDPYFLDVINEAIFQGNSRRVDYLVDEVVEVSEELVCYL